MLLHDAFKILLFAVKQFTLRNFKFLISCLDLKTNSIMSTHAQFISSFIPFVTTYVQSDYDNL